MATLGLMVLRDLSPMPVCDVLTVPKHHHCVPPALEAAPSFSQILEVQGTKREHSSVVARERERLKAERAKQELANSSGSSSRQKDPETDDGIWIDPAVVN